MHDVFQTRYKDKVETIMKAPPPSLNATYSSNSGNLDHIRLYYDFDIICYHFSAEVGHVKPACRQVVETGSVLISISISKGS